MKHLELLLTILLLSSCNLVMNDDNAAHKVAEAWAEAYFNCDFHEAAELSTPESKRWLQFAASNATEEDIALLNNNKATVMAEDGYSIANDTLKEISLRINNFLENSTIGSPSRQIKEGEFVVKVVSRNGKWLVKMEGLPQSERQSRD
jgi:hypothetical protein